MSRLMTSTINLSFGGTEIVAQRCSVKKVYLKFSQLKGKMQVSGPEEHLTINVGTALKSYFFRWKSALHFSLLKAHDCTVIVFLKNNF